MMIRTPRSSSQLQVILEQHLSNPQTGTQELVTKVVKEYVAYLRGFHITIPEFLRLSVEEELKEQVEMLMKIRLYNSMKSGPR